jgi:hypothetical protein
MAQDFIQDPIRKIDRTYPSGVARERPMLNPRIYCEADEDSNTMTHEGGEKVELFNRQLRAGHTWDE